MDSEKFQELVLRQLSNLTQDIASLNQNVAELNEGQRILTGKVTGIDSRMDDLHAAQQRLEGRIDDLDAGQKRLEGRIDKLELRLEDEVIDKIRALFDAREVQQDINARILTTLDRIEAKIDVLQMETASIRRIK